MDARRYDPGTSWGRRTSGLRPWEQSLEGGEVVRSWRPRPRGGIGTDLLGPGGAGDDRSNGGSGGEPADGHVEERQIALLGVPFPRLDEIEAFRGEVAVVVGAAESGTGRPLASPLLLAREESVGQGEVGQQAEPVMLQRRDELCF